MSNNGLSDGMIKRQSQQQTVTNYITIYSIDEHFSKIEQSGGKVIVWKTKLPDIGFIIVCFNSVNNMIG